MIPQTVDRVKRSFKQYKQQSDELAAVYDALFTDAIYAADLDRWEGKLDRVKHCGTMLMFSRYKLPNGQLVDKLDGANFCRVMLCPMCQWRRAHKLYGEMLQVWKLTFENYREIEFDSNRNRIRPRLRSVLLTLTVPNVPGSELRDTIACMSQAWNRLNKGKGFTEWKAVKGYYRCLEVTYNAVADTYHPHYHVLLLVDEDYFKKDYVSRDRWLDIWRQCYRDSSIVAVDVRALRGSTPQQLLKSLNETCKYTVKPSDFLRGSMIRRMSVVETLDKALDGVRRASFGGWLKQARQVLKLDKLEFGADAVELPAGAEKVGLVWLHWSTGAGDYLE